MRATDFFTKTVLTMKGPVTVYISFFIHLQTRKVALGGITPNPNAEFMKQMARNLTDFELVDARFIIRDGDKKYLPLDAMLPEGMEPVLLPPRSPNLNVYAERFVKSIKTEALDKLSLHVVPLLPSGQPVALSSLRIPMGEEFLRHVIKKHLEHYHDERNIGNALLFPDDRMNK